MFTSLILVFIIVTALGLLNRRKKYTPPVFFFPTSVYYMLKMLFDHYQIWPVLAAYSKASEKAGGILSAYVSPHKHIFITDPDVAAVVLNTFLDKDDYYSLLDDWVKNCIFTASGSTWKAQRKNLAITFNPRLLETFTDKMNFHARRLAKSLSKFVGQPIDIFHHIGRNSVEALMVTMFGLNEPDTKESIMEYLEAVEKFIDVAMLRAIVFPLQFEFIIKLTPYKKMHDEALETLHSFSRKVIAKRKEIRASIINNVDDQETTSLKLPIDKLLELEEQNIIDYDRLRSEVDILFYGGHDTSAGVLRFFLILLGVHHDVQDNIYNEITNILQDLGDDSNVTKQQISQLTYLDAALKESMRLYPVGAITGRRADKDLHIKNYTIPKGSSVAVVHYQMHRHPMWGPDAEQFRPERWLEPGGVPSNPVAFSPFSWGKRNCMGQAYGMLSMKIILVHLLRRFRVSSDLTNLQLHFNLQLKPIKGNLITLSPRL